MTYSIVTDVNAGNSLAVLNQLVESIMRVESAIGKASAKPLRVTADKPNLANFFAACDQAEKKVIKVKSQIEAPSTIGGGFTSFLNSEKGKFANVGKEMGQSLQMGMTQQFGMAGSAMGSLASAMGPVGIGIAALSAATIGLGAASVGVAAQFQSSMARVASVSGAGAADMQRMSDAARAAGASSVFSASQAADAMYFLASSGMSVDDQISSLNDTLNLASAGGLELARSGEIMTGSLAQFALGADQAGRVSNLFAATSAAANTDVTQLGDAMKEAGPMANAMGMSIEETSAALAIFANSNIKGAQAGTGLKSILGSMAQETKTGAAALAEMGLTYDNLSLSTHSYGEVMLELANAGMTADQAIAIFGKDQASVAISAVAGATGNHGLSASYDELKTKITGTQKATQMSAQMTDNYNGAMKMLSSAVEEAEISLGSLLLGPLTSGVMLFTNLTNAAIATGKAIYDTAGAFNSWVSSSDTVKKGAELETAYEEANKGHYEMMAGDSVWVPDQVAPTVAKVLSQSEKFSEAQSIASSMGTQSGTSYADALSNALDTKLPSTFTDAYLGPAAAALKDASTKAGTTAGEDFATAQETYIKNWQAGGVGVGTDKNGKKYIIGGNSTGSGFQGDLPALGVGSSGQIATLMDNYSYQLFKKTGEGAEDVYKVYDKTGQEISGNFINVAEIERQFQDTIIDLPKFFDKRSDEISNILADATSDGIITGGEDGERQMLEDLLAQTQAAKLIVPIGFDTTKLDSQIDDLEKTLSGMKIGIDISKESFALTAAQYEYENTDLYKKMYGEGIIATDTSEDSYFRLMDDLSGSTKEGDVKTVAALKDLDKRIGSGDKEQLGIAKADAALALKTHPEIIKQTGFQQRMVLAGITLNEGFRLIGDEVVPISDASVEIQDNTKDTAVYAQGIFELLAAGGFRGVVNNVNYYGTTGEAKSITPWSDLQTPTTWGTSKIGAAMPSSRDLANALTSAGAKYQSGGVVGNTGIAHVEEGEVIVPADQLAQSASLASWGKQSIVSQGSGTVSDRATSAQWSDCVSGSCRLQTESTKQNIDDWNSGIRSSAKDWSSGNVKTYSIDDWDLIYPNSETCISFNEPDPSLKFTANVKKINFDSGAWKMIYPDSETCISYNSPDPSLNFTPATNGVSSAFRGLDKTTGKTTDSLGYLLDAVDVLADGIFETSDALKNFPTGGPTPWSVIDKQISVGATGKPLVVGLSKEGYVVSYDPRTDTCDGLSFNQPDPSLVTTDPFYLGMTKNNPIMGDYESGNGWQNVAQAPKGSQLEADQKSVLSTLKQQQQEAQQSNQQLAKIGETSYAASKAALSSQNSNKLTASNTATMKPLADSTEKGTWETADNTAALINQGNAMMQGYIIQGGKLVLGGGGYSTTGKYANGSSDGGFGGTSVSGGGGWVNANPSSDWGTSGGAFSNGSGGPGWMQAATPGFQWAEGGIVDHATLGVFGESGREAFVPISDRSAGRRILPQVMRELGVSHFAAMGGGNAKSYSGGYRAVTVNVYPSPGMNESQLTEKIIKEIAYFANGGGQ